MFLHRFALAAASAVTCITACAIDDIPEGPPAAEIANDASAVAQAASLSFTREHVTGDIYHYEARVPIGRDPNAALRLHRVVREVAPFVPRPAASAVLALHGDFATFETNFAPTLADPASPAPGLAPYLAARGVDVWGVDRRWTLPGTDDDVSDFDSMGLGEELGDVQLALALVRETRAATGSGGGKVALLGFSHGAQLAYHYAATEAARPPAQRHIDGIIALDFYGAIDPADESIRGLFCGNAAWEQAMYDDGYIDAANDWAIAIGELAGSAPTEPSPILEGLTNREAMLEFLGRTYQLAPFSPTYHLLAPTTDQAGTPTGFAETSEEAARAWLVGAPPHQSMLESAELDSMLCGEDPPVNAPLSAITVPVFHVGAAGGTGTYGLYTTTQVSSTDVTTLVASRGGPLESEVGHADLLFADDAATLAWDSIATWLAAH